MTSVSVIIPTFNRLDQIKRVLHALGGQVYPFTNVEVLVISDGSTDGTDEYLANLKTPFILRTFSQTNRGVAAARNLGVTQAAGDIVLFIDDDVVPTPELVGEHLRWHKKFGDKIVVIGPMLAPLDFRMSPWVEWEQQRLGRQYDAMVSGEWQPTARQFYTGNTSLARRYLIAAGGFDPAFRRAEDVELAYRLADLGLRFLFNPQAIGYHYAERSYQSWVSIPYIYGRNDVIFACQKGQAWILPTIFEEFYTRHVLIRGLTRLCLGRPVLANLATSLFSFIIKIGSSFSLANLACSAVFNLRYYQGVADEMGGRKSFLASLAGSRI
jgi:GT2 family glycosyltransferase